MESLLTFRPVYDENSNDVCSYMIVEESREKFMMLTMKSQKSILWFFDNKYLQGSCQMFTSRSSRSICLLFDVVGEMKCVLRSISLDTHGNQQRAHKFRLDGVPLRLPGSNLLLSECFPIDWQETLFNTSWRSAGKGFNVSFKNEPFLTIKLSTE